jgi:hypothetical protein
MDTNIKIDTHTHVNMHANMHANTNALNYERTSAQAYARVIILAPTATQAYEREYARSHVCLRRMHLPSLHAHTQYAYAYGLDAHAPNDTCALPRACACKCQCGCVFAWARERRFFVFVGVCVLSGWTFVSSVYSACASSASSASSAFVYSASSAIVYSACTSSTCAFVYFASSACASSTCAFTRIRWCALCAGAYSAYVYAYCACACAHRPCAHRPRARIRVFDGLCDRALRVCIWRVCLYIVRVRLCIRKGDAEYSESALDAGILALVYACERLRIRMRMRERMRMRLRLLCMRMHTHTYVWV